MTDPHDIVPEDRKFQPQHVSARNARYGLVLFFLYLLSYGAFVAINAFRPEAMDWVPKSGVPLSIWYGFGLIIAALLLALIYTWLCRAGAEDRA